MNVSLPKRLDKTALIEAYEMEDGNVYRFKNLLVSLTPSDGVLAVDTNDSDVIAFNNVQDFTEYLDDQDIPLAGELTGFTMCVEVK